MNKVDLKQEAELLMIKPGNVKGEVFRTHAIYINYREGEEGLKRVEEKTKELGFPVVFLEIKPGKWYKEALSVLVILTAKDVFNWTEKDIYEMGSFAPKHSFIVKIFVKHFLSVKDIFIRAEQYWQKHYDFGFFEKVEFNEDKKYIIVAVKEYAFHPVVYDTYFRGYFTAIAKLSVKSNNIKTELIKNISDGDNYNEYKISWE